MRTARASLSLMHSEEGLRRWASAHTKLSSSTLTTSGGDNLDAPAVSKRAADVQKACILPMLTYEWWPPIWRLAGLCGDEDAPHTWLTHPSAMGKKSMSRCSAASESRLTSVSLGTWWRPIAKHTTADRPMVSQFIHVWRMASRRSRFLGPVMTPTRRRIVCCAGRDRYSAHLTSWLAAVGESGLAL